MENTWYLHCLDGIYKAHSTKSMSLGGLDGPLHKFSTKIKWLYNYIRVHSIDLKKVILKITNSLLYYDIKYPIYIIIIWVMYLIIDYYKVLMFVVLKYC